MGYRNKQCTAAETRKILKPYIDELNNDWKKYTRVKRVFSLPCSICGRIPYLHINQERSRKVKTYYLECRDHPAQRKTFDYYNLKTLVRAWLFTNCERKEGYDERRTSKRAKR